MAFGLMCCCFFTALERASCSSSSDSSVVSAARDLRLNRRQIFFSRPSSVFLISCLRSHPRGILAIGREFGSRCAVSVSSHVWWKDARVARLRGEGTMAGDGRVRMLEYMICYIIMNTRPQTLLVVRRRIVGCACRPVGRQRRPQQQSSKHGAAGTPV